MTTAPKRAVAQETLRGTLRIERLSGSSYPIFEVTFRAETPRNQAQRQSILVTGSEALVALLDGLRMDFEHPEVKQAVEDLLLYGSCFLPDMVFSSAELSQAGFN
jgi:hypothetical protein